jgi:hypothetical protein
LTGDASIRVSMVYAGRRRALQMQWSATAREYLRIFEATLGRQHETAMATVN